MYDYIKGIVVDIKYNAIVVENQKIGFLIYVSNPYAFTMGKEYQVYLYQQIREDENCLYGFLTAEEKDLFLKLISVKGLGCKMALPILAVGSIDGIMGAIESENVSYLKKFPKIGDKLAKQMILDLKGKLGTVAVDVVNEKEEELLEALTGLGYKEKEVKGILSKLDSTLSLENQIKQALQLLLGR